MRHPPNMQMCLPTQKVPNPNPTIETFMEASSCRHDELFIPFPLPSLEGGHWGMDNSFHG